MKVCRVIMDMSRTQTEVYAVGNPWAGHISAVQSRYQESPKAYYDDLLKIMHKAKEREADLLIFPACTFVLTKGQSLEDALGSFNIKGLCGGVLEGDQEYAFVRDQHQEAFSFNASRSVVLNDQSTNIFTAISSSVKQFKSKDQFDRVGHNALRGTQKSIVCDMGHHQYSGRYILTLRSVQKKLSLLGYPNPAVVLSFWKYRGSNSRSDWAVNANLKERLPIANSVGGQDFLDLIDL